MTTNPQPAPDSKPGLLVVDDDPLITDTLAFALRADYEVHACDNRQHASFFIDGRSDGTAVGTLARIITRW